MIRDSRHQVIRKQVGLACALALGLFSFAQRPPVRSPGLLPAGKRIDTVICSADPSQSYAIYIPSMGNRDPLPVLFFFDPHADGSLPLAKYAPLAEAYGFILVGSNNAQNGSDWPVYENIWKRLYDDVQARMKVNTRRIYVCGFSGGAKVASYIALQHPLVKAVIAGGAGLPDGVAAVNFPFSFTGMAGEGDMNLTDLVALDRALDRTSTRHRMIRFDGKHEWAPLGSMNLAFAGLQFDAMHQGIIPKQISFINRYASKSKMRFESDIRERRLIAAARECILSIPLLEGLSVEAAWFKQKEASLTENKQFQAQLQEEEHLLDQEQQMKRAYLPHFPIYDKPYWIQTIRDLNKNADLHSEEGRMYQRLLAYLSLAFYSLSNHFIAADENIEARHSVEIYTLVDPANSEAWYFSAVLDAREGLAPKTEADLLRAVDRGFNDKKRLTQQAEFQNLDGKLDLAKIERQMQIH